MTAFNSVRRIDQDMHGKVEMAAAAVPEWPNRHYEMVEDHDGWMFHTAATLVFIC